MSKESDFLLLLQEFIDRNHDEHERIQQELRENDELVHQSTSEIERLAQRNSQLRSKLAAMESNLDSFSRAEIRSLYQAASEAQIRLFMMRNRVEQLQAKQQLLERYAQSLQGFATLSQYLPERTALTAGEPDPSESRGGAGGSAAISMGRVIEAQEAERFMLARQMHDGPAQSLTNLILQAELCERLFAKDPDAARQELAHLKGFANSTFQKIRDFIFELRPMMLDDLGLAPTLKRYIGTWEEKYGIPVRPNFIGQERRLSPDAEITLFRGVQELLTNVVRHAQAQHVQVTLDLQGQDARLLVEDDGSGFDMGDMLSERNRTRTVGLTALRERVEMMGGEMTLDSAPGRGTRVLLLLPVSHADTPVLLG